MNMFGADVSVVINTDLSTNDDVPIADHESDDDNNSDLSDADNRSVGSYKKQQVKQLSKFEKALQEVGKKVITHSLTLTHLFTHSPTHSLTYLLTLTHLLTHSLLLTYLLTLTHSLTHPLTHSLTYLLSFSAGTTE